MTVTVPDVTSIEITGSMLNTSYYTTSPSWSPAGLIVTATYEDNTTENVTSNVQWSYNPILPNSTSITSVTVTATFSGQTDNISQSVMVTEKISTVVISEVYGAGGNSSATYKHDFIELYNNSNSSVDLTGWTLYYASATGVFSRNTNMFTDLSGTILAKSYLLVRQAAGTGGIEHPVTPDILGSIAMGANNFKLALTNSADIPSSPFSSNIVDFIGAGTANDYETAVAPAPQLNDSIKRSLVNGTMVDTDNNSSDFTLNSGISPNNSAVSVASRIMDYESGDISTPECSTKYATIRSQITSLSSGSLAYFKTSEESVISNARQRYIAWSTANGDTDPYGDSSSPASVPSIINRESNNASWIIFVSLLSIGCYVFLKTYRKRTIVI